MKKFFTVLTLAFLGISAYAYERLQGPTEVTYWDRTQTYGGYTFFSAQGTSYLIDMEGRLEHTWPLGINPRMLDNGHVLDAANGSISGFTGLREVDWNGSNVWFYTESRTNYFPHQDFLRIYNPKFGAYTTLYIANKTISSNQCIAAGCNPASAPYTNVTVDAVVEVDMASNIVWEWCFFDHGIQDCDASKSNYVGTGKSISNYAGRINLNLSGRPLTNDWLHCVSLDYNTNLDQIAIAAEGGEFYVIDHGNTFISGNATGSIALAASSPGDFLYRFGDPARYNAGSPPSITLNWTVSTTGNKQIGGVSQAVWIPTGLPGAGHFLVFNNGQDLFETTPQSYIFEVDPFLNSGGSGTGSYVDPPGAGYTTWSAPGHDTDKQKKSMSKQIVSMFYSMANQAFFSDIGGSVQRLPNSNLLVCAAAEGHIFEATPAGTVVWEYINPVTTNGFATYKRDDWPLANAVYRATRYATNAPALSGHVLTGTNTVAGAVPSYISAPTISGVKQAPTSPSSTNTVLISATITNSQGVGSASLTYTVASSPTTVSMTQTGVTYSASIPAFSAGTLVSYFISAADTFGNAATDTLYSYTVQSGSTNPPPVIVNVGQSPVAPTSTDPVTITATVTDAVDVAAVTLTYTIGTGGVVTNTVFSETMGMTNARPWPGTGCDNSWALTYKSSNPFEQSSNWNYGAGNPCGMQFKQGTANLTDSVITAVSGIMATGTAGYAEFYLQDLWSGTPQATTGWTFQLDAGSGFVTRLSGLTGATNNWQLYHYDLSPAELVTNLHLRFQFAGGSSSNRINLDQISIRAVTTGGISSNIAMTSTGGNAYSAQIPAQPAGITVSYYVTAMNSSGGQATNPPGAPTTQFSYTVAGSIPISFTPQYVRIPGGSYIMGDHFGFVDPDHPSDEIPLHNVCISPFYMSTTLLTCREYCDYLNIAKTQGLIEVRTGSVYAVGGTNLYFDTTTANAYSPIQWDGTTFSIRDARDLRPITSIRWFGAVAYCNWLSAGNGYDTCYDLATGNCDMNKNGFRLPTEAEWEYAGRGGLTNPYCMFPWGDDTNLDGTLANWAGSGDPFESTNSYPCTTPVGFYNGALRYKTDYNWPATNATYPTRDGSNPYGLYDMGGNVWEWCNDWYASDYYTNCVINNIVTNPPGPASGDIFADHGRIAYRTLRGGTWWNGGGMQFFGYARVSNRDPAWSLGSPPDGNDASSFFQVGFRVMRPENLTQTVGLFLDDGGACPGYTLMSPMQGYTAYLLNNVGQYVHTWTSPNPPGRGDYLLENGHYIRECSVQTILNTGGGEGGRHEEYDWEGNLVWAFDLNTSTNMSHHDFKVLPNGNLIMIVCEKKTLAEVIAAGFNTNLCVSAITTNGGFMLPDAVYEVQPTRPYGGNIVWEWHVWDHLIQDYDSGKSNYGIVSNNVGLINGNPPSGQNQQFWNHFNGIDYNPQFDQILISCRCNSEIWIIDHSTTTAQAAGHTGGKSGKGGDLVYRWGNPVQYKLGTQANQMLWQQHCCTWIPSNCPNAGHILIFDNGVGRGYTSVDEIVPPAMDSSNNYYRAAGTAFGPTSLYWTYTNTPATNFYCSDIGGAEREPNGNTLITHGTHGTLFEVTTNGTIVWSYVNPSTTTPLAQGSAIPSDPHMAGQWFNEVFKVHRYATNFVGLSAKDLTPRGTVETYTGAATDTVGLGLPDIWVRAHFGSLSALTSTSSHSTNGLTDIQEYEYGLNPLAWSSTSNGIPDGWALACGFDPTLDGVAGLTNVNGFTTLQCYLADLNPTNPASILAFVSVNNVSNSVYLTWIGGSNAWQYLECSTNLLTSQWTAIYTNIPPTPITNTVISVGSTTWTNLFYRIRAWR